MVVKCDISAKSSFVNVKWLRIYLFKQMSKYLVFNHFYSFRVFVVMALSLLLNKKKKEN